MKGLRIAMIGLGRSGLAAAIAAQKMGAIPIVYDHAQAREMTKPELVVEARASEVELRLGWKGEFNPDEIDVLVANPAVDHRAPVLRQAAAVGIGVWSEIEFGYRVLQARFPSGERPLIVAITGTNGKSTTSAMTYRALQACDLEAVLCGNVFGTGLPEETFTEAVMNATPDQILVAEISSFQLEWVETFRPDVAAITMIAPDHLDRYDSFADYRATKLRIWANQSGEDIAILPDDLGALPPARTLTVGGPGADAVVLKNEIQILDKSIAASDLMVIGAHHRANVATAGLIVAAVCRRRGMDFNRNWRYASASFRNFRGIAHRMEVVGRRDGRTLINNSMCTNPRAVVSSAEAVEGVVHLLIGGRDKVVPGSDGEHEGWAPVASLLRDQRFQAYLYGEAKDLLNAQFGGQFSTYNNLQEAFQAAIERAKPGETIMLAPGCASTDQFHDFRERGNVFRTLAKEWLDS